MLLPNHSLWLVYFGSLFATISLHAQEATEAVDLGSFRLQLQHRQDAIWAIEEHPNEDLFATVGDSDTWGLGEGVIRLWSGSSKKCLWKRNTGVMAGLVNCAGFSNQDELVMIFPKGYRGGNPGDLRDPPREQQVHILSPETGETLREFPIDLEGGIPLLSRNRRYLGLSQGGIVSFAMDLRDGQRTSLPAADFPSIPETKSLNSATRLTLPSSDESQWTILVKGRILEGYRKGELKWRREIELKNNPQTIESFSWSGDKESMMPERIEGDTEGKHFVIRGGMGNIRGGDGAGQDWVKILNTATGETLWEYGYPSDGLVSFHVSKNSDEVWMLGHNQRDQASFWRSAPFAKVRLDGSNGIQHFPEEFEVLSVLQMQMLDDRHLLCSSPPPVRKWCWDLKTLEVIWVVDSHEPESLLGRASIKRTTGGDAIVWKTGGAEHSVDLSGSPVAELEPEVDLPPHLRERLIGFSIDGKTDELELRNYVRLITAISGREILWFAHSQEGYFSASRNAGPLLGIVDDLECYGIEQFALRLNRPDILLERLGTSDLKTLESFRLEFDRRVRKAKLKAAVAPDAVQDVPGIRILGGNVEGMAATLEFEIVPDESGVISYNLFHQGIPVYPLPGKSLEASASRLRETISLIPGENKVEISCLNRSGVESARATKYLVPSVPGEDDSADLYFFGVGVSEYGDERISDLNFADDDARDLAEVFRNLAPGYRKVHARVLTDDEVTRSVGRQIREFFSTARPQDTVVVFIAGHGLYLDGVYYYLTADTNADGISTTALDFSEIEKSFDGNVSRNRLLLLDTCESGERIEESTSGQQSGSGGSRSFTPRILSQETRRRIDENATEATPRLLSSNRYLNNDLFGRKGVVVISSCADSEAALEHEQFENGLFSEALIAAFEKGGADINGDGILRKAELISFVGAEVSRLIKQVDPEAAITQTPRIDRDNLENSLNFPVTIASVQTHPIETVSSIPANIPIVLSEGELGLPIPAVPVSKFELNPKPVPTSEVRSGSGSLSARYQVIYQGSEGMSAREKPGAKGIKIADIGPGVYASKAPEVQAADGSTWVKLQIMGWMPARIGKNEFLKRDGDNQWKVIWNRPNDNWVAMRNLPLRNAMLVSRVGYGTMVTQENATIENAPPGYIQASFEAWICVRSSSGTQYLRRIDSF